LSNEPNRAIVPCEEFGEVLVPFRDLLREGELDIYPEVASRGFFDIDYRKGGLVLKASRYVGLIPINDRLAIHVRPRVTIAHLLHIIAQSGDAPTSIGSFSRGYSLSPMRIDSPETVYIDSFVAAVQRLRAEGLLKKYVRREQRQAIRGRLLVSRSVASSFSRGMRHRPVFEVHEFSHDCVENQILKATSQQLCRFCERSGIDRLSESRRILAVFLRELSNVSDRDLSPDVLARIVPTLIRDLPRRHRSYEFGLWLSMLLALRAPVSLETLGSTRFDTLVVDVSGVFERYMRKLLVMAQRSHWPQRRIMDGNRAPIPLFTRGLGVETKPDIYVIDSGRPVAVLDVKYKLAPSREDRYELLAFCEALGVQRAAFICPQPGDGPLREHHGTTRGGTCLEVIRFKLHASDCLAEESRFADAVGDFLSLSSPNV
jgi:5-methylcytosine-specific restriction enzyme subunit McrC